MIKHPQLKGVKNFLIIYGAIMSGMAFLTLITNLPGLIFRYPLVLSLSQMPAMLPVALAYLILGIKFYNLQSNRYRVFLWINILSLIWFLLCLAAIFFYNSQIATDPNYNFSGAHWYINYLSPFFYASIILVPGIIILKKLKKVQIEEKM